MEKPSDNKEKQSHASVTKVAFIGLGVMGYPMAGHLSNAGYPTTVYNRSEGKAHAWAEEHRGSTESTPAKASENADIIFMCVGNDDDVRSVVYGKDGILSGAKPGSVLVDHTTTSASLSRELAERCQETNVHFIDAPVSGGQAGAENGVLTVMAGGEESVLASVEPVMASYSKAISLMGPVGSGQLCKMVNQLCIAGLLQGLSEGITLAKSAGLDVENVIGAIKHGAAGSWQMENRGKTMANNQFDFGFAIDWMRKDLGICFDEAKRLSVDLPIAEYVDKQYAELQERGFNRCDTSVLIKQFDDEKRD
ncbi:NAD(P)-dependent oxidoreductase [Parasalinivibrio latis]|uniref:NAD(P)-dependent oxidoreductase n=1 Tax=Parasalinivibrio latis TaxID=2952610 RepID=UPI0030DF1E8F